MNNLLTDWLDTEVKKNKRLQNGYDVNDADCVMIVWSTDSFQSFPQVMAFHVEAMKFLDQIDCDREEGCFREQITDNTNRIEIRFWTKKSSDFFAILQTVKEIFFSGSPHHRVTSVDCVRRESTKAKMRLGMGGESKSNVALSAKLAFEAYLELNHICVHGNDMKGQDHILVETDRKTSHHADPCRENRKSPQLLVDPHRHSILDQGSPGGAECELDLDSAPPLTNHCIKICTATGSSSIGQQQPDELKSLLNQQCPVACWSVESGEAVPCCIGTLTELGDCHRVLGHVAKHCLHFVGEVSVGHAGDRGFTQVSPEDLRQIYCAHPFVPLEITIAARDFVDAGAFVGDNNSTLQAGCNVYSLENRKRSVGCESDGDSSDSPTIVGSNIFDCHSGCQSDGDSADSPTIVGSNIFDCHSNDNDDTNIHDMSRDEIAPPQKTEETGPSIEESLERDRLDKESSHSCSDLYKDTSNPELIAEAQVGNCRADSGGRCDADAEAVSDSDSEQMEILLDTHGLSGTTKSLLVGRMMDEFHDRPCWTIHLGNDDEVVGMKFRTNDLALFEDELQYVRRVKKKHSLLYAHCTVSNKLLQRRLMDEKLSAKIDDKELDDYACGYMSDDELSQWRYYSITTDAFGTELDVNYPVMHSLPFAGGKSEDELRSHMSRVYKSHLTWLRRLKKISHRRVSGLSRMYASDRYLSAEMEGMFHAAMGSPILRMIMENLGVEEDEFECEELKVEKVLSAETMERLYELFIHKISKFPIRESTGLWPVDTLMRCQEFLEEEYIGQRECYNQWHRARCAVIQFVNNLWNWTAEGVHMLNQFEHLYRESNGLPKARTKIVLGGIKEPRSSISSAGEESESQHRCDSQTTEEVYSSSLGSYMYPAEKLELERKYRSYGVSTYPDNSDSPSSTNDIDSCSDDDPSCISSSDSLLGGNDDNSEFCDEESESSDESEPSKSMTKYDKFCSDGDTAKKGACNVPVDTSENCSEIGSPLSAAQSGLSFQMGGGRKGGRDRRPSARKRILDDSDSE
ncbi:hypothetical protein THAOC_13407 [Thalassiosira oceanica]|uniref:Uncharacterized protein n=1 Tax=Thalassiosira oceanica TaxID=159749 RepID=K0T5S1_THAOC|nr:hypothetical protein THAOC_13407 [Thalassiosira oceanica]|eukprot:EJK65707.1 hypothetical protein THAOC_13407 [Thalassiosira oceanica]